MPAESPEGLTIGSVSDNLDPQRQGRIQVMIPSEGDVISVWAPMLVPFGFAADAVPAAPEVGAQVIIAFVGGDPDRPVVLGQLHGSG